MEHERALREARKHHHQVNLQEEVVEEEGQEGEGGEEEEEEEGRSTFWQAVSPLFGSGDLLFCGWEA